MKNYLQVEIDGKKAGLKFVYDAMKIYELGKQKNPDKYFLDEPANGFSAFTVYGFAQLIDACYEVNCDVKKVEREITFEEFYDQVEEWNLSTEGQAKIQEIQSAWVNSSFVKITTGATVNDEKKSMSR